MVAVILTQVLLKSAYEALATPLTYLIVNRLKRTEGVDAYDRDTNFNPLLIGR
jgi:2-hydroxychromene-2-carboxylate isomerase